MQTKILRIEQKEANIEELENALNKEIKNLESQGKTIKDIRHAVGRDADEKSGIDIRFSITVIIMYE